MSTAESFTLEDLLNVIEKQASEDDGSKADNKDDKAKGSDNKDSGNSDDKSGSSSSGSDDKKDDEKDGKDGDDKGGQEKSASEQGAELAKQIMEKVVNINKENTEMSKQASVAGKALADAILTKLAAAGDVSTENGVTAGTVPQKNIADNAQMVAQDDTKIQALPGTDGAGNGGSVNQIFDAIVQDALAQGGTSYDQTATAGASAGEGKVEDTGIVDTPAVDESQEKMAALLTLCENGVDFDTAVNLIKEAEQAIAVEEEAQIKQAALSELIGQGFDFETAANLVKEAGRVEAAKAAVSRAASAIKGQAHKASVGAENLAFGAKNLDKGIATRGLKQLAGNRLVQAGAGAAAIGAGAAYAMHQKKAAFEALIDAGVDFEKAAQLVASKAAELGL